MSDDHYHDHDHGGDDDDDDGYGWMMMMMVMVLTMINDAIRAGGEYCLALCQLIIGNFPVVSNKTQMW